MSDRATSAGEGYRCPFCLTEFAPQYWSDELHQAHLSDCKAPQPVIRCV